MITLPTWTAQSPPSAKRVAGSTASWLRSPGTRRLNTWVIDQLNLQPYQHVLELGFGSGQLLEDTARTIKVGFIAGVESSVQLHQQAYRRNRRFIARQMMQLHLGEFPDLPYPPHYFHTIYGASNILSSKYPEVELQRLTRLLRSRGRLALLFNTKGKDADIRTLAQQVQQLYIGANLNYTETDYHETSFGVTIAITGKTD